MIPTGRLEALAERLCAELHVAPGEVVVLLGDPDTAPVAVPLAAQAAALGAAVRPWLGSPAVTAGRAGAPDPLLEAICASADVVIGLNVEPPAGARRRHAAVPTHAGAQAEGVPLDVLADALLPPAGDG
jgi:hypothetical protein